MSYPTLRSLHLLFALISLPYLMMYGVSAVQMAHSKWFDLRSRPTTSTTSLAPGISEASQVATNLRLTGDVRGKLPAFRVVTPGVAHDVTYDAQTGTAVVKTSRSRVPLGMLNRLHHAAGLWPTYGPLRLWGAAVGIVSLAAVGLSITGIWMWWLRKQDRVAGTVLIGINLAFAVGVLALIRSAGP